MKPEPYWTSRDGRHCLYLGDCLDVLPGMEPGSVDAVVTDPPYGLGKRWQGGKSKWPLRHRDGLDKGGGWDATVSDALLPALQVAPEAIVWGGNYYPLPPKRGWLIWDKIVREFSGGHVEMAWTTLDQPTRAFNYAHGELASEGKYHPTQKPLPLMEWCLRFLPDAITVFDPFAGSGTTGVACIRTGRRFVGVEIERKYADIAVRRMERELSQPHLPGLAPHEAGDVVRGLFGEGT